MEITDQFIFIGGLLLCLSVLASIISNRTGAPLLLAFLGVGIFFGEDGPGGIVFNDVHISYSVCSIALAIILFDGGLHTRLKNFKTAFKPAFSLATIGVFITAMVTGASLFFITNIPLFHALLFGSIVASTDAAAVFLLLRQQGLSLSEKLSDTLEVESGLNDPMAIFLTLTFVALALGEYESHSYFAMVESFVKQMGIGATFGYTGGRLMIFLIQKLDFESGLFPIFAVAGGLLVFGASNILGGSGFLAIYITGLLLGNHTYKEKQLVEQFMDGLAWLAQLVMLLVLGLLVTPSQMMDDIPLALITVVVLMFCARPLAVFISLIRYNISWKEKIFMAWVGLRGAVPIYLALIPVIHGLDGHYFNIAFIVVVFSLLLQGWTIRPMAKITGVDQTPLKK